MSSSLPVFPPVVTESRPQAFFQLGQDVFFQQRHQPRDPHRGEEQGRQGWYPAHTAGPCVLEPAAVHTPCVLGAHHCCFFARAGVPDQLLQRVPAGTLSRCDQTP